MPAGTRLTMASRARSVIAGRSHDGAPPGKVDRPMMAPPKRTRSSRDSGIVSAAAVLAMCLTSA